MKAAIMNPALPNFDASYRVVSVNDQTTTKTTNTTSDDRSFAP